MNIKRELASNDILLLVLYHVDYEKKSLDLIKSLSGERVIYITTNKTFDSIETNLQSLGVDTDKISYIDALSKSIKSVGRSNWKCHYMNPSYSLEELFTAIDKSISKEKNVYLIFDSLTNLLVHNLPTKTEKFITSLTSKIREGKNKGVYFALNNDATKTLISKTIPLVNKTLRET